MSLYLDCNYPQARIPMLLAMCENKTEKLFRPFESCESPLALVSQSDEEQDMITIENSELPAVRSEIQIQNPDTLDGKQRESEIKKPETSVSSDNLDEKTPILRYNISTYGDHLSSLKSLKYEFGLHHDLGNDTVRSERNTDLDENYRSALPRTGINAPSCHSQCQCCAQFCKNYTKSFHFEKINLKSLAREGTQRLCPSPIHARHRAGSGNSSPENGVVADGAEAESSRYFHLKHLHKLRDLSYAVRQNISNDQGLLTQTDARQRGDLPSPNTNNLKSDLEGSSERLLYTSSPNQDCHSLEHNTVQHCSVENPSNRRRLSEDSVTGDRDGANSEGEEISFDFEAGEFIKLCPFTKTFCTVFYLFIF